MAGNKTDLVMFFTLDRQPVWAESPLQVAPDDTLMKDFYKNTDYDSYSNFFEVTTFSMGMKLTEQDASNSAVGQHPRPNGQPAAKSAVSAGPFARWRSATPLEYKKIPYPFEFDKFTFERVVDSASPIFFECCCKSRTFDTAVLIKRLSEGEAGGVFRPSLAYLRIEFTKVLITSISWEDGDLVKENCDFICQGMKVTYRKQSAGGTIGGGDLSATWPNPKNDRSLGIRVGNRRT